MKCYYKGSTTVSLRVCRALASEACDVAFLLCDVLGAKRCVVLLVSSMPPSQLLQI